MERGQGSDKKDGKENNDCQSLMDKDKERDEQIFFKNRGNKEKTKRKRWRKTKKKEKK